ncbi:MAG TPA: glycoside hydrolase family 127 protein [Clostridia bacterium]|nr:glycoside hydrolase family 127 protein [Clostridia bacterium]
MLNGELKKLPLGEIKPKGWLLNQLKVQAEGLSGHVTELFDDLGENSAWLGGKGESWERGPYYLDGLVPLAFLLDDVFLKQKAQKWIDSIISSQNAEGFFGPKHNLDWWPRMVVTKMLPSYYEATGDERVIPFLLKYYSYMLRHIERHPLYSWANARGLEELIGIDWLYGMTRKGFLIELGKKIIAQSMDWGEVFENFPYTEPSEHYIGKGAFNVRKVLFYGRDFVSNILGLKPMKRERIIKRNNHKFNRFYHLTHGVNIAMALKYPALKGSFIGEKGLYGQAKEGYRRLMMSHGTAAGLYTCDEHLSGPYPTQGIELCTVAEAMFSAEKLYENTSDNEWADLLELLCFSTFPATFTKDMCAHQYVQQVNQISATTARRSWYDSYNKANIYGLKPNYACCLSNMHQGFPKFCEHLAFKSGEDTLSLLCPSPMEINTKLNGNDVSVEIISDYPFRNTAIINIKKGNPKLRIRIPENAKSIFLNFIKHTGQYAEIAAKEGEKIKLSYDFDIVKKKNADNSVSYYYGNLLLALPVPASVTMKEEGNRFSDREMSTDAKWNYAPDDGAGFTVVEKDICPEPFSTPCVSFKIKGYEIPCWKEEKNQAGRVPEVFYVGAETVLTLVPYGSTLLRIAHFPEIKGIDEQA